jgi:hypothetical protein
LVHGRQRVRHFDVLGQSVAFFAGADDQLAYRFEVCTGGVKAAFELGCEAALDLYGP